jgi:hypothetical protein
MNNARQIKRKRIKWGGNNAFYRAIVPVFVLKWYIPAEI